MIGYRRASAADIALIHALLVENASNDGGQIEGTRDALLRYGFGPDPLFRTVLAFDSQPLGLSLFFPEYSSWRGAVGVYVQDLYLRPAAPRQLEYSGKNSERPSGWLSNARTARNSGLGPKP